MMKCGCEIPNKANVCYEVVIGRDIPGGTETTNVDIYVCNDHDNDDVRKLFRFDNPDEWDVLECVRTELR